jgi:hypothetical protein
MVKRLSCLSSVGQARLCLVEFKGLEAAPGNAEAADGYAPAAEAVARVRILYRTKEMNPVWKVEG